ncbi:MAG: class I SAM-dependent methyltransferase, partial [Heliobacteriaceae bacterium]|nr:class I SAM-dependent methyltransferase [Heliobacteriaceae bacterium]
MNGTKLEDIDWNGMWQKALNERSARVSGKGIEERWDRIAPQFRRWMEVDDYPVKLMRKVRLRPGWSVLDVGCGTGAVAIPAAKKAARVTALDISGEMLRVLKDEAEEQRLSNITYLHCSWDNIEVGKDVTPHDVVVASRSVGRTPDLRGTLEKIDSAALKYVYITAWGGGERGHVNGVRAALGKPNKDTPDYIYFYNVLHQMGIRANIEHLECHSRLIYTSLDDAMESCKLSIGPLEEKDEQAARDYLNRTLLRIENGMLEAPGNRPVWSLIWW